MILLLHPLIGSYGSHTMSTKYIISWISHDFKKISSRDQVQIWGLTSYSNTPRMEIPSAWLGTTEFIYLAVLQQSIQVDRVIVSWCESCDQGSCDHSNHLFSLRKFGCFLYMRRRCSFESPCLDGSFVGVFRIHQRLNKIKQIFLFIILRL